MSSRRHPQVVNVDEVEGLSRPKGRFGVTMKRLGTPTGAKAIGFNWMELQPGKTSFPCHFHTGIEEGLFILSGSGLLRIGKEQVALRAGDFAALPPGPDFAHALTNTGAEPLRYLSFSNQNTTDICVYPDSNKIGFVGLPDPSVWPKGTWLYRLIKDQPSVDYYEGENTDEG